MVGRHAPAVVPGCRPARAEGSPGTGRGARGAVGPDRARGTGPAPVGVGLGEFGVAVRILRSRRRTRATCRSREASVHRRRLHTVLVSGEAGIGKTTLIAQATRRAHGAGAIVLLGHCDEDLTVPYQPWIQALSYLIDHLGTEALDPLSPVHRAAISRLLPALRRRRRRHGRRIDSDRLVLMHAVRRCSSRPPPRRPSSWSSTTCTGPMPPRCSCFGISSRRPTPCRSSSLATIRHTDLAQQDPLTRAARRPASDERCHPAATRWPRRRRDRRAPHVGGRSRPRRRRDRSGARPATRGRREPVLHRGVGRAISGSPVVIHQGDGGRWVVPRGTHGHVAAHERPRCRGSPRVTVRARRRPHPVVGGRHRSRLLAGDPGGGGGAIRRRGARRSRSGDRRRRGDRAGGLARIVPLQPCVSSNARCTRILPPPVGSRTHQRVAEAIEAAAHGGPTRTAELARHWVAAIRPAELDKALYYVMRAGDEALAALAPDDAIRWFQQARELDSQPGHPHDGALRCRILIGLGTAQRQLGLADHRATLLEAVDLARATDDADLLVAAILASDRGVAGTSVSDEAWVSAVESGLDAIGPADSAARARLLTLLSQVIDARELETATRPQRRGGRGRAPGRRRRHAARDPAGGVSALRTGGARPSPRRDHRGARPRGSARQPGRTVQRVFPRHRRVHPSREHRGSRPATRRVLDVGASRWSCRSTCGSCT